MEGADNGLGKGRLVEVDDVLNDIVAEGILNENPGVLRDSLNKPKLLITSGVIDAALQNTASMSVGSNLYAVVANGIKDELSIDSSELVETLLDDMVAIEVLDQLHNAEAKGLNDDVDLLWQAHVLNHFLKGTGAVLVQGDADHVLGSVLNQDGSLVIVAKLEELLAQIITKGVRHELDDVLVGFSPDHVHLIRIALLKLLLKVTTAVLVLAQIVNLAGKGLQGHVLVAGHGWYRN